MENINEAQMGLVNKLLETVAGLLQPYLKLDVDTYKIEETVKEEMYDVAADAAEDVLSNRFDDFFGDSMGDYNVITEDTISDWVQSEDDIDEMVCAQIRRVLEHDVSIRLEVD